MINCYKKVSKKGLLWGVVVSIFCSVPFFTFAKDKRKVDLIVLADYLVPMSDKSDLKSDKSDLPQVVFDGAVAVVGNKIIAIDQREVLLAKFTSSQIISGKNKVLMPGLINAHTHSAMTLFRGMADDLELMPWLNNYIFPMEGFFVKPDFIKTGLELACYEMISGGITTFVDMYFYPEVISKGVEKCGLRAIVGAPMIDFPSPGFKGWDDSFAAAVQYVNQWQGKNERITPAFAPHAPYTVSPAHIKQVAEKARELKVPITIHIAESEAETKIIKDRYQTTPVKHVDNLSLFTDNKVIAAHMVHLSQNEMKILAQKKVGAIHNPTSNLKLAAGISPVVQLIKNKVNVGLGTDGAASNNDLDLWEEIRLAALLHKVTEKNSTVIPAYSALQMATNWGAKSVGLGSDIGQLRVGYKADMIQISLDDLRLQPVYNVISHLVYTIDSQDVVTTVVSGKVLMKDGKVLTVNETKLRKSIEKISKKLAAELKK